MADPTLTLTFDPSLLPTTQHRAGLAGLLLVVEAMRRRALGPLPEVESLPDGRWRLGLSKSSLKAVFDDLYSAGAEEQMWSTKRTKGKGEAKQIVPPKREERVLDPKTGKEKTLYVYDQVVPRAPFLEAFGVPAPWLKLWRDAMWSTVRGIPTTRGPYEARATGKTAEDAEKVWRSLTRFEKDLAKGVFHTVELAGCLCIGAQAAHADNVPFYGRADETLLLHFWPAVAQVFVPQMIDREGKIEPTGYVFAVPDVLDYLSFCADFPQVVAALPPEVHGIRPAASLIAVPEEGALEYVASIAAVARARAGQSELAFSTSAVEVYHLEKRGNTVPVLYSGRVNVTPRLLFDYEALRRNYLHPLFRRQLILNLLKERPWYAAFDALFSRHPHGLFIGPKGRLFQSDFHKKLRLEQEVLQHD
jgi:CRISPR-associated protein Cmx8